MENYFLKVDRTARINVSSLFLIPAISTIVDPERSYSIANKEKTLK